MRSSIKYRAAARYIGWKMSHEIDCIKCGKFTPFYFIVEKSSPTARWDYAIHRHYNYRTNDLEFIEIDEMAMTTKGFRHPLIHAPILSWAKSNFNILLFTIRLSVDPKRSNWFAHNKHVMRTRTTIYVMIVIFCL